MKKFLYVFCILIITIMLCSCISTHKDSKITDITNTNEAGELIKDSHLASLINLKTFSKKSYDEASLLSVAMNMARNFNLIKETNGDIYLEYVSREDLHNLIYEFSDVKLTEPINIEDFYYLYDEENDYYYIVPVGIDSLSINKIEKVTKQNETYTITCLVYTNDTESSVSDTITQKMIITLNKNEKNKHIPYTVVNIIYDETEFVANYNAYKEKIFGTTKLGNNLVAKYFTPTNYTKTILLNFAIHGFEDNYDRDGEVLVDIANDIVEYYKNNLSELNNTRLIIIPCANPDGLYEGNTNNGFGRCNSEGIDLNRDFDAKHKVFTSARNKTLSPFSAEESQALRDFILDEEPNFVIDFHGWLNMTIGDTSIANLFKDTLNLNHKTEFNDNCNGYFSYWCHLQGAESLLVEFKDENIELNKLIKTINDIINI